MANKHVLCPLCCRFFPDEHSLVNHECDKRYVKRVRENFADRRDKKD